MDSRQFVSYCIIALLFILDKLIEIVDFFVEFLEDAEAGAENFLTEELGWEVTKIDD
jgi:hypothetical protein